MRHLFIATAVLEVGAGVGLIGIPSSVAMLLVGAPLPTAAAVVTARVGGAGLLALGIACWLARGDARGGAARALLAGMLVYNAGAAVILGVFGIGSAAGVALWPAVALHVVMAGWCVRELSGRTAEARRGL